MDRGEHVLVSVCLLFRTRADDPTLGALRDVSLGEDCYPEEVDCIALPAAMCVWAPTNGALCEATTFVAFLCIPPRNACVKKCTSTHKFKRETWYMW